MHNYSNEEHIDEVLSYITGRFGPVTSFSGSYHADSWTLNIQQNTVPPGKTMKKDLVILKSVFGLVVGGAICMLDITSLSPTTCMYSLS